MPRSRCQISTIVLVRQVQMNDERTTARGPGAAHDERRRGILEAVFALIDAAGTDQVSIRNVAREAQVSVGRVQHYFPTKDDLLSAAFGAINDRGTARVSARLSAERGAGEPATVLGTLLGELIPRGQDDRRTFRIAQAFETYAMSRPNLREQLARGYAELADLIALLLGAAAGSAEPEPSAFLAEAQELLALSVGFAGLAVTGNITPERAQRIVSSRLADTLRGLPRRPG